MAEERYRYKQFRKKPGRFFPLTATVMFIDIVGFTKYGDNEALRSGVRRLQETIDDLFEKLRWDEEQGSNDAIMMPTGDGYGIGFEPSRVSDEDVLRYAGLLSSRLAKAGIPIRMGINNGPCWVHRDLNAQLNLAGWGIIHAARAMACGSQNHILCTEQFAKPYLQSHKDPNLHEIGPYTFKARHLALYNYYSTTHQFGNPTKPKKNPV
jgi:class 3 adenylate cyclase